MKSRRAGLALFFIMNVACLAQEAIEIGSRRELFVDRHVIDKLTGSRLALHEPVPAGSVLKFDRPWEGRYCGYVTVFRDGAKYMMYYRGLPADAPDGSKFETTCYAESADGKTWTKPDLGIFEVNGTRNNNVVLADMAPLSHNFSPFLDDRPGVPSQERFKALTGCGGLTPFASHDGLHWKKLSDKPVITKGAFDSQNLGFWSESEGCYVAYFRIMAGNIRSVGRATSKDFLTWTDTVPMTFGDTPMEHLYTNQTSPYFRAPHIYIAVAARFMPGRRVAGKSSGVDVTTEYWLNDCSDAVFMTTRGGDRYDRTFMEGFIRPGIGLENWVSRTNYPALGIVPTGPSEISLFAQHAYAQPSHELHRYTLRTDGFVSVQAPYAGGEMLTRPIRFKGRELEINFATSAAGALRVEIQDAAGRPINGYTLADCDEILGNEVEHVVTWKGKPDVAALAGRPVRLRFVMKDADLYAIRFRSQS